VTAVATSTDGTPIMWDCTVCRRAILTTGLLALYLAACLAALSHVGSVWSPFG
jgi:hypothetical protein